ncbi:MAG TPA: ubiquitin-like small modifier protein 1 [Acidimicrobiales bacterium]
MPDVRLPTVLRPHAGGQSNVHANGGTLDEVIGDLVRQFPNLAGRIKSDDGAIHRFVNVYVNDEDVRYLKGLDTEVTSGDVVAIVPAVAGG